MTPLIPIADSRTARPAKGPSSSMVERHGPNCLEIASSMVATQFPLACRVVSADLQHFQAALRTPRSRNWVDEISA